MIILSVNPDDVVRRDHICYFTKRGEKNILKLMVVEEVYYKHPEAPEIALLPRIETREVGEASRLSQEGAPFVLLEAAQNNITSNNDQHRSS